MKTGYIFSFAFSNIMNHKRHMFIMIFGFTISITMLLSINLWAQTSEDLAIIDFLETQDFQAYIYSAQRPEDIDSIITDLDKNPLVDFHRTAFVSYALFNTEDKLGNYTCLPEGSQNSTNPVSITNAFIANQNTLDRIKFIFNVEGNFTTANNGIMVSVSHIQELNEIYDREFTIGDTVNLSIGKNIPRPSNLEYLISDFQKTYFQNYTIQAVYTVNDGVSILQSYFGTENLVDSIIFPMDSLSSNDVSTMISNDVPYLLFVKFEKEEISKDGMEFILEKMELFKEKIEFDYIYAYVYLLDAPIISLINAYSRASLAIVFMVPIILIGLILTIFTINIIIENRQEQVALLRDRGADTIQILLIFIIEFISVALFGIILGIGLSFIFAALIPSFSSSGFNSETFNVFFHHLKFPVGFAIGISLTILVTLIGYASLKIWLEISLKQKSAEHEKSERRSMERNLYVGLSIGACVIITIALIFSLIDTINKVSESQNFTLASTTSAGYTFILFCFLFVFIAQFVSFLLTDKFLVSIKGIYRRLVFNDAFFLMNSFKRKDKKLSSMSFAILLASTIIIFSLISASSVALNQEIESDFKNGSDLRISTYPYPLHYSFKNNISEVEGVNEVVSFLKTEGTIAFDDYTVYGVDAVTYSRVGIWDKSSFSGNSTYKILQELHELYDGVIISEPLSERLNFTIDDLLPITWLPGDVFYREFTIVGIINSAPGLGLADGRNVDMLQPNEGFVFINEAYMINELEINSSQLFLASIFKGEDLESVEESVEALLPNIDVNLEPINAQIMGSFIESYIPNVQIFFYIELISSILIILVLLIMFTDFTISQRSQEFAIALSIGKSRRRITKLLFAEIIVIVLTTSILGILLGIAFTYSTFFILTPILTSHNIIPFTVNLPFVQFIVFPFIITAMAVLGTLPSIIKQGKQKVIEALRI